MNYKNELLGFLDELKIIDSHEHLSPTQKEQAAKTDFLSSVIDHYLGSDLFSSGMSQEESQKIADTTIDIKERFSVLKPYYEKVKYTGYGCAFLKTLEGLYGFTEMTEENIGEIQNKYKELMTSNSYKAVLKEKCNIATSLNDSYYFPEENDEEFIKPVFHIDYIVGVYNLYDIETLSEKSGMRIHSFNSFIKAAEAYIRKLCEVDKIKVFKSGLAYYRSLNFKQASRAKAEETFDKNYNKIMPLFYWGISTSDIITLDLDDAFSDYMMHFVLNILSEYDVVIQFHTGIQTGSGNILENSNPTHLANLFLQYPNVKFDVFHIGFPYHYEASVLVKNFQNVYLNMCWSHTVCPTVMFDYIVTLVDTIPLNKIIAFGGDACNVDAVYGHYIQAKENLAEAFSYLIEQGYFDIERAKEILSWWLYQNPVNLYKLEV